MLDSNLVLRLKKIYENFKTFMVIWLKAKHNANNWILRARACSRAEILVNQILNFLSGTTTFKNVFSNLKVQCKCHEKNGSFHNYCLIFRTSAIQKLTILDFVTYGYISNWNFTVSVLTLNKMVMKVLKFSKTSYNLGIRSISSHYEKAFWSLYDAGLW